MIAIGIDIGGTSIKGAAVKDNGEVLDIFSLPVNKDDSADITLSNLVKVINDYNKEHGYNKDNVLGIGCGVPGVSDTKAGVVTYSNNLQWYEVPIVRILEEGTGLPVKITNDANAAALGEAKYGAGREFKNIIMVTLGTGVGGGIVINGKLYEGNLGKGAELGHMVVVVDGRECTCGRKGCLEAYASATGLIYDTKQVMKEHRDSKMWEIVQQLGKLDARVPFEAARMGDEYGEMLVNNYVKYLGEGLMNYFNIFRPEAVVLSGGIANEREYLNSRLRAYCKAHYYGFRGTPDVKILTSELGYNSGKIGAAALFFE